MGEKKIVNNMRGLATGVTIAATIISQAKPAIEAIAVFANKTIEERKKLIAVPKLYLKSFPYTAEDATKVLNSCGLKATIIDAPLSDANPKWRDCFVGQVIGSEPKANRKVEPGRTISVKCITQEVIEKSQRLYEEAEIQKAEAKARRDERIEHTKTTLVGAAIGAADKIKERKNKNTDETKEGEIL